MIWLLFVALTLIAVAVVIRPLWTTARATREGEAGDVAVYRDQLKEIDRDFERGMISAGEADAARTEIKRRILAAGAAKPARERPASHVLTIVVPITAIVLSLGLYFVVGRPGLPGRPFDPQTVQTAQDAETKAMLGQVEAMVAKLAQRLKDNPNDAKGWRLLGWFYLQMDRVKDGVAALARAAALDPQNADLLSQYGEALVFAAGGTVTPDALKQFDAALARDPKDARARFYRGLALAQSGMEKEALALWVEIIREGPKDAEWIASVRARAMALALKLKLDPKVVLP